MNGSGTTAGTKVKLAVFIAVAAVFAPGWGDDRPAPRIGASSDVAARMLAPTFEEATARSSASVHEGLDDAAPDKHGEDGVPSATAVPAPAPLGLILAILGFVAFLTSLGPFPSRLGRAPPHLLTV